MISRLRIAGARERASGGGFTLMEVVISTAIVGIMLVAALHAVGQSRVGMRHISTQTRGVALAQELLNEILQQSYADPEVGMGSMGLGGDEVTGHRSKFEDVDDYDGWKASPPETKDGTELSDFSDYERQVSVEWVEPGDPTQVVGYETGVKRITVTVLRNEVEVCELVALRTSAWPELIGEPLDTGGSGGGGGGGGGAPPNGTGPTENGPDTLPTPSDVQDLIDQLKGGG